MNNNLLLQAKKFLEELGIITETAQTILKINRESVAFVGLFGDTESERDAALLAELKNGVSKKLFFDKGDSVNYHLNAF